MLSPDYNSSHFLTGNLVISFVENDIILCISLVCEAGCCGTPLGIFFLITLLKTVRNGVIKSNLPFYKCTHSF